MAIIVDVIRELPATCLINQIIILIRYPKNTCIELISSPHKMNYSINTNLYVSDNGRYENARRANDESKL